MAAVKPQWLATVEANSLALTPDEADEEQQKIKLRKLRRKEQKKRRLARMREAKRAKLLEEMENKILKVQCEMHDLVEQEKQKSERFLSLARKYYGMWKTLNEECRQQSVWKSESLQAKDAKSEVAVLKEQNFTFPVAVTSVTMDKRFSDNATSGTFKIVGETLNISSGV